MPPVNRPSFIKPRSLSALRARVSPSTQTLQNVVGRPLQCRLPHYMSASYIIRRDTRYFPFCSINTPPRRFVGPYLKERDVRGAL